MPKPVDTMSPKAASASASADFLHPPGKPGDWMCPRCDDLVFALHAACRRCGTKKPHGAAASPLVAVESARADVAKARDWTCPGCNDLVFGRNDACRKCGVKRPDAAAVPVPAALRPGDWRCPKCSDVQFARNQSCRKCGTQQPQWLGSAMSMAPPEYWTLQAQVIDCASPQPWIVVPASEGEREALRFGMFPGGTLGGRDQRTRLDYKGFNLVQAWRLQHRGLWGKYAMERENIRTFEVPLLQQSGVAVPPVDVRREYRAMMDKLPGSLDDTINEVYLSHGSKPESVLAILSGGLNERFSGGLFGNGTYLAEDVAKNDQYCTYDECHGAHPELHRILFDGPGIKHHGNLLYVFFCRVVLGCRVRTADGRTDLDRPGASVWSSEKRELASVHGSSTPLLHHSLLVETGGKVARFREFVVFHGDRLYPEYLCAYKRA